VVRRNRQASEHLTKAYREIGIRAVAAAVKSIKQKDDSEEAQTDAGRTKQGEASMSENRSREQSLIRTHLR
jgi:hypothetical protein